MDTTQSRNDYIEKRRQEEALRKSRAAEKLKDHQYTCLVQTSDVEVWRCKADKTTAYAFDIMMTRYGIAIVGDIDNLTFSVGLGYGMKFLAGDDVTYYLHTKLSESHKKRVFSENLFRQVLVKSICSELREDCSEAIWDTLPDWAKDVDLIESGHWDEFRQLVLVNRRDLTNGDDRWMHWDDLLSTAEGVGFTEEAQEFMRENAKVLCLGEEWYEHSITEVCGGLISELYLINHAAKAIMAKAVVPEAA
ncbi:hypothetical protein C1X35_19125 [Pseudomonas sp. FW306-1C-G01A]|uniref:hypothetical protein n=1 Tax=unclassified Pseudomonas TaxID=196821 RepID=UPI000C86DD30|nr:MULTISPECIES: hypothetical protein [unclassified Pseudomonas]PMV86714.1 hypothetical protein C1X56_13775 [Pseudomonas sp. GW101-1A09]PMV94471.1 hypothetical protein C1X51_12425 [Pseudomonas sp. FW306-2-2C-B10A]PMW04369.1 hypothetical protein C1X50_18090 [Pseudomonas sp. MPR-TSA4]PMW11448.1 hypothetical protein C1X52_21115 [Pseudomonas sp. FW306-2-1A-C05A]PMW33341.1 hypothetical protein C1X48_22725 [Pseudomonas sp. FW305-3-2-15-A-R2A1]